ncbi:hypothetical protein EG830_09250 [bacterium]|nr:hypothetical protein [bacterium]
MGPIARALRASVSCPGITTPVIEGNHLVVDGGVLNNLPIDIMKRICSGRVIAAAVTEEVDLTVSGRPSRFRGRCSPAGF